MKTAVETIWSARSGSTNRRFLQFCSHYLVDPVACTPRSRLGEGASRRIRSGWCGDASSRRGCAIIDASFSSNSVGSKRIARLPSRRARCNRSNSRRARRKRVLRDRRAQHVAQRYSSGRGRRLGRPQRHGDRARRDGREAALVRDRGYGRIASETLHRGAGTRPGGESSLGA